MIDNALRWFWDRVGTAASVPARSLVAFRWIFGAYLLFFDARYFAWIDQAPDGLFNPPLISLPYLVGGFLPAPFLVVLDIVAVVAIFLMTIGYRTRLTTSVVFATLVVSSSFGYSFGKISHQILLGAVLLCMIITNWGQEPGGRRQEGSAEVFGTSRRVAQGMSLLAIMIVFGFITAGFDKVRYWVNAEVTESGILSWFYPRLFEYGDLYLLADFVPGTPAVLLKAADISAALLEVAGIFALLGGRILWRTWLAALTTLYLANALVLNITFTTQVMIYLAFVSLTFLWSPRFERWRRPVIAALALVAAWHVWVRLDGRGSGFSLWADGGLPFVYDVIVCLAVLGLLLSDIRRIHRESRSGAGRPVRQSSDEERDPVPVQSHAAS